MLSCNKKNSNQFPNLAIVFLNNFKLQILLERKKNNKKD